MKFDWKRLLPKYWYQNSPTDWDWDATLNDILDKAKRIEVSTYTTTIDGVTIWTSNWPYAYGAFYHHGSIEGVPSIRIECYGDKVFGDLAQYHYDRK